MEDFKRFFFRGLTALLPTILTIALLVWAYHFIDRNIARHLTNVLITAYAATGDPTFLLGDAEEDALIHGTPINEWDGRGRRLTEEYKIITLDILAEDREMLPPEGQATSADQIDQRDWDRAQRARRRALWQVAFVKWKLHLVGFLLAVVIVYFMGFFLASLAGKATWRLVERLLRRTPLIRAVYPNIKQVTDFLLADRTLDFSGVVAVEYPRQGIWSLGLRTGSPMKKIQNNVEDELVTIFIPSSPTPITGYCITVPVKDTIDLDMTIDEALRYTISAGVIKPGAVLPQPKSEEQD